MKKYFALHPALFKLDGGAMFGIIPKPLWERLIPADELNRIELSLRVMLIQTAHKNILIDTGIGDYHGKKFENRFGIKGENHPLLNVLKKNHGLNSEDITDIIISHLHFDHVGGLGENPEHHQNIFPNATIHLHRQHYDYALNPTIRDAGSFHAQYFKPIIDEAISKNKIHWINGEDGLILQDGEDKILFKCSHGHTPFLMHAYDEKFIYMADLVPTSAHIPLPWVMGYDISPGITTKDKERFYHFILEKELTLVFEHDPVIWGGKIQKNSSHDFSMKSSSTMEDLVLAKSELNFD